MAKRKENASKKASPRIRIEQTIRLLALKYAERLQQAIAERIEEMKGDTNAHFLIYQVLGMSNREGQYIDEYQNKGRFLYKDAGSLLEEAAKLCFLEKDPKSGTGSV